MWHSDHFQLHYYYSLHLQLLHYPSYPGEVCGEDGRGGRGEEVGWWWWWKLWIGGV